jgi:hypothetical protein
LHGALKSAVVVVGSQWRAAGHDRLGARRMPSKGSKGGTCTIPHEMADETISIGAKRCSLGSLRRRQVWPLGLRHGENLPSGRCHSDPTLGSVPEN